MMVTIDLICLTLLILVFVSKLRALWHNSLVSKVISLALNGPSLLLSTLTIEVMVASPHLCKFLSRCSHDWAIHAREHHWFWVIDGAELFDLLVHRLFGLATIGFRLLRADHFLLSICFAFVFGRFRAIAFVLRRAQIQILFFLLRFSFVCAHARSVSLCLSALIWSTLRVNTIICGVPRILTEVGHPRSLTHVKLSRVLGHHYLLLVQITDSLSGCATIWISLTWIFALFQNRPLVQGCSMTNVGGVMNFLPELRAL